MKLNFHDFARKCQFPLMLAFGSLPVVLVFFALAAAELLPAVWAFTGGYILLALLGLTVPGKRRLLFGLASSLALMGLGALLTARTGSACALIGAGFYVCLLLWGLRIAGWAWNEEISPYGHFLGLALHIGAQILLAVTRDAGLKALASIEPWLLASFFGYMLMVMLSMSRDSLFFAAKGKQRASASMRRKNTLMVLGLFGVTVFLSLIPAAARAVRALWRWLAGLFAGDDEVYESFSGLHGGTGEEPAAGDVLSESEPGWFLQAVEKVLHVLAKIVMAAVLVMAVYLLFRLLVKLVRRVWQWLNRYTASVSEDYVDEITDIRETGTKDRLRRPRRERGSVQAGDLPPEQRVRRRYLRLLTKHPEWAAGSTARENLPEDAAAVYERARYSGHPISQEEAARFHAGTRKV